jgi:hypothetical protein
MNGSERYLCLGRYRSLEICRGPLQSVYNEWHRDLGVPIKGGSAQWLSETSWALY